MRWAVVAAIGVGCAGDEAPGQQGPRGGDDTASPEDTGEEPPVPAEEPCPLAGEWEVVAATAEEDDSVTFDIRGKAEIAGTATHCTILFDVVVDDCPVDERVELFDGAFGLWQGYTDGAPGVGACRGGPDGPRALGVVRSELVGDDLLLEFPAGRLNYLQITAYDTVSRLWLER